ncbi:MAG: hypothetical protein ABIU05_22590 [Nitrospirales bacterium]
MTQSETRYDIMEGDDEGGFIPSGFSEWTLEETEAQLQKLREQLPEVYRNAFICETITTRMSVSTPEVQHELQTIP